jgi:hypothetical protein
MEIQYSQLKINHLKDTPSTKAAGGGIYSGVLLKDVKVPVKVRRTLSSVGTSSSNTLFLIKVLFEDLQLGFEIHQQFKENTPKHVDVNGTKFY